MSSFPPSSTTSSPAPGSLRSPSLPSVPVEVLEQILKYAFVTPELIVPSSPLPSNKGKLSILLVSHAIHNLVLPLLFDTLTLARPSDFRRFFHSTDGLLVGSGPVQTKRRQAIKRIIVTPEARIPLNEPEEFASQGEVSIHDAEWLVSLAFAGLDGVKELVFSEVSNTEVMTELPGYYGWPSLFDPGMVMVLEAMKKEGGPFHEETLGKIVYELFDLVGEITRNRRVAAHFKFFHSVVEAGVVVKLALSNWSQHLQGEDFQAEVEAPSLPLEVELHDTPGEDIYEMNVEGFVGHVRYYGLEGTGVRLVGFEEREKLFRLAFELKVFALEKGGIWRAMAQKEDEEEVA